MLHGILNARHVTRRTIRHSFAVTHRRRLLTLAIETSCDDTCVAILEARDRKSQSAASPPFEAQARLIFNEKITARNNGHGGIHPVEALESHHASLATLVERSVQYLPDAREHTSSCLHIRARNGVWRQKPDFISVTRGPGMRSNLNVGLDTAKGLATAWQIPMLGVHHMQAHALTPRLVHALQNPVSQSTPKPDFPFLTLLVSGGHTMLLHSQSLTTHRILVNTVDTAIGDCLDKCGRSILPPTLLASTVDTAYAKYLSNYAFPSASDYTSVRIPLRRVDELDKPPTDSYTRIQAPLADTRELRFSFAGIPSQVDRILSKINTATDQVRISLARASLAAAFEHLGSRTVMALESLPSSQPVRTLVVSGGVAANPFLRYYLRTLLDARGFANVELVFPPVELCTDNAAMIAWAGIEMFREGWTTGLACDARRKWSMDADSADGGILGVGCWEREQTKHARAESGSRKEETVGVVDSRLDARL